MLISNTLAAKNEIPAGSLNPKTRARLCRKHQQVQTRARKRSLPAPFIKDGALSWVPGAWTEVHILFICLDTTGLLSVSLPNHLGCLLNIKTPTFYLRPAEPESQSGAPGRLLMRPLV